jgi:hypothetical protein
VGVDNTRLIVLSKPFVKEKQRNYKRNRKRERDIKGEKE